MTQSTLGEEDGEESEHRLLVRVADGAALWELWERHRADLYRLCVRWMNGRIEDAQDACSNTLLKIRDLLPADVAGLTNPGAWLARVAFNVCMDLHRDRGRRARLEGSALSPETSDEHPDALPTPEEALLQEEMCTRVRHAVDHLPASLRQPVLLRFFGSLTHQDIATLLSLNECSVRKRIQYAREILARRLAAPPRGKVGSDLRRRGTRRRGPHQPAYRSSDSAAEPDVRRSRPSPLRSGPGSARGS
jgi:RNA polymerase sigma-70 factor (ECF subfamily)